MERVNVWEQQFGNIYSVQTDQRIEYWNQFFQIGGISNELSVKNNRCDVSRKINIQNPPVYNQQQKQIICHVINSDKDFSVIRAAQILSERMNTLSNIYAIGIDD
ncbi:hypothetical protein RF11_10376 [Thelohanellus kitauei]|uniref:Uncharacterized protein n=1 Tax=Thelohanellus kitauei TaxID=669202 RepID=A0A0C2J4A6_THEKT|nr:hypothetical protein RF11_10376 [Thelohanellus kitauei]